MNSDALGRAMIGYLNYSEGTPSPAFQKSVNEFYRRCLAGGYGEPWKLLQQALERQLGGGAADAASFGDVQQAQAVVELVFDRVLPAYRRHHQDLLAHRSDHELFQPFFLTRVFEAVLAQQGPWDQAPRIVHGTLTRLNDFLGHRPVAVLETAQKIQPYAHERVRPVPLYLRSVGAGAGLYESLITGTIEILAAMDKDLAADASFRFVLLDELAVDPRAYDFGHPANQRPGYQFGEWDPQHLDRQGRYRRFVLRWMILDAIREWMAQAKGGSPAEIQYEAAAALAGTVLLASGISGAGPETHDSETSLATLVPRIAACRDAFYERILSHLSGDHGERLRAEAKAIGQPFGGIRRYLNHSLARLRAAQLQADHLAQLYARMGYAEAARQQAQRIPTPSIRLRCEIQNLLTSGHLLVDRGAAPQAAQTLPAAEDLLHRAIECGAIVDPWNILGFQGQFSLFTALENSVTDPRVDLLLQTMQQLFDLHGRVLRESAAQGLDELRAHLTQQLESLAQWWDRFATIHVSDVRRVHGSEAVQSAAFLAEVLAEWHRSGKAAGDIKFWRKHSSGFTTPQAYGSVVEALLQMADYASALALLMHWLSQSADIALEEGGFSFHSLAGRWLDAVLQAAQTEQNAETLSLANKFFDFLEVNADENWRVPGAELFGLPDEEGAAALDDDADDLYAAAYEGVSYRDSAADGHEGSTLDGEGGGMEADALVASADDLRRRLHFLQTVARLWQIAAGSPAATAPLPAWRAGLEAWTRQAEHNRHELTKLLTRLNAHRIPRALGSHDSIVEYDRRQAIKEDLLTRAIATTIETAGAVASLLAANPQAPAPAGLHEWEARAIALRRALQAGDAAAARARLLPLLRALADVPLLYVPLADGGTPAAVFEARYARETLRYLVAELPRLGLLRETYDVLKAALGMEKNQPSNRRQVTEFNLLFPVGFRAVIETLVEAMATWESTADDDEQATALVGLMVGRFSRLWIEHIAGVRLSELERSVDWDDLVRFIQRYGRELFTQKFMAFGNLRGILHQGTGTFLQAFVENQDPYTPSRLAVDLGTKLPLEEAARHLEFILRAVLENYDAYKDYNTITTQSDYGDNLHILLDFLRIQAGYERHRWALEPAYQAHGILARKGRVQSAQLLQRAFAEETAPIAARYLLELEKLEQKVALRLPTIADKIGERFVKPLQLDRVLALVAPAVEAAWSGAQPSAFANFEKELEGFSQATTGAGLEVPHWLRKLEIEVQQTLTARRHRLPMGDKRRPRIPLTYAEYQQQVARWDEPYERIEPAP